MLGAWILQWPRRLRTSARRVVRRSEAHRSLLTPDGDLAYQLKRSSVRRTLALQVREAGQVVVQAPQRVALAEVERFILDHWSWLRERLAQAARQDFVWANGMALSWFGAGMALHWQEEGPLLPCLEAEGLHLGGPWTEAPKRVLDWYQGQAAQILPARLAAQAARMGVVPPPLRLSNARTRWGSLSTEGRMNLNWRLVLLSAELIDYVICHELAHLRQHNHSPAFWREVEALYSDYRSARLRLRREGGAVMAFGRDLEAVRAGDGIPEP